ncbi:F-box protein PP2-B10-like [Olea europaea var. sylvestris]|uniref:F-box protein PP2-B10-like n=1 Tax=Olea europaea var. sylvestris TaxID=158386 RepID=UPI000C1CF442|nr:F-box protein PP2-B10-like [Olea europaea var. sylvestris]
MSNNYDNWERLVEVVLRREQFKQLALISSSEPSFSSTSSSTSGWNTPICDDLNVQLASSSSTVNETDWERLLPPDYEDIISRSVNPVDYATKEDLYTSLCSSPILLDGGKMSFHIDKTTGKKCYMIGPVEISSGSILMVVVMLYGWRLTPHADSRFSTVVEQRHVLHLDIWGKIETQMLSPKTHYAAYLVYRLDMSYMENRPAKGIIKFENLDEDHDAERRATALHLQPGLVGKSLQTAVSRPDGWMEVQLGMFYNDVGDNGPVEARLLGSFERLINYLVIEGIEFRPASIAEKELGAEENVRNRRNGIFSKLRISG